MIDGLKILPGYLSTNAQQNLLKEIRRVVGSAPLYRPVMPQSGHPFSVEMTSCGPLGWVSDKSGYRYQPSHPETGKTWPAMPDAVKQAWNDLSGYCKMAECCLVNYYREGAKMGLHRDKDEDVFDAPVVSLSLGDQAIFRVGGLARKDRTMSFKLSSGDALVLAGPARLAYHGIDRILPGTSTLLKNGGRINLTLRRVTAP